MLVPLVVILERLPPGVVGDDKHGRLFDELLFLQSEDGFPCQVLPVMFFKKVVSEGGVHEHNVLHSAVDLQKQLPVALSYGKIEGLFGKGLD